ncbi:ABC transporter permease [Ideonella sp. DXS29W]|uniref:ABC transporter permease n=1 Tax=Ideonella lacteola TaxID=2984193 RepID=A0ABU9BN14_9BURK
MALALVAAALVSLVWQPWPPAEIDVNARLQGRSASHWLGTDSLGRDVASQLLVGSQTSLLVGVFAVAIGLGAGVLLGLLAAARGGWVDEVVMRLSDFGFAFPALLSAILLGAIYGPGLATGVVAIGLFNVPVFARTTRAAALQVWSRDYVLAARAAGFGRWGITRDHVLPNIASVLIVQATVQFSTAIIGEAALGFLGLGAQPPRPSWGRMLAEAQTQMFQAPSLAVYPGAAIALAVLGLNLLGDGLRDLLDPRLARQR